MKRVLAALGLCLAFVSVSAFAQISQTSYQVNLAWTAPSVCTAAAPCTYPVSRTTIATGASCPLTGSSYSLVGTSASQAVAYSDTTVAVATSYCYALQTTQAGATSAPSAPLAVVVPTIPGAPATPSAMTTVVTVTVTTLP